MIYKTRFIEPGNYSPYKKSIRNFFVYNGTIRNPATGLIGLATIVRDIVPDTLMYSESISRIDFTDVMDADIVFISINTYNALRGYEIATRIREESAALIVFGGMHATLNYRETITYADYILTGDGDESIVEFISAINTNSPINFRGVIYRKNGEIINNGRREQPEKIDTVPDRDLVVGYRRAARRYDTLWPQVHASRGCPHNCAYCSVVLHFGRKIRRRSPKSVADDIERSIAFHRRGFFPRLNTGLWITDDNFPQDREWAMSVLREMIDRKFKYHFSVQARFEVGFDEEMLVLMKKAGFSEITLGIEFLDDDTFSHYKKKSKYREIVEAIANIRKHGIGVRGLFIVGTDYDRPGIGERIADFVIENRIHGALIQSLFFTPGTAFYEEHKSRLIHENWNRYDGNVVHYPKNMRPHELQEEIIRASRKIYSKKRLLKMILTAPWFNKVIFIGEYFWHRNLRKELRKEIPYLKSMG